MLYSSKCDDERSAGKVPNLLSLQSYGGHRRAKVNITLFVDVDEIKIV
jgi:hypothetical protein